MRVRVKKAHDNRVIRLEALGNIKEILFNEDLLNPEKATISVFFRGQTSSGIIDLDVEDAERISNTINEKKKVIKGVKVIRDKK